MQPWAIGVLIALAVIVVLFVILGIVGSRLQKKQDASNEQMKAMAQQMSLLVLDKKKVRLKDANIPKIVLEQTPKYLQRSKVPIVKAKVGPNVMDLMCDAKVFDIIPLKKEVKASVSGIYIIDVKGVRGSLDNVQPKGKKMGFRDKLMKKKQELDEENAKLKAQSSKKKK